MRRGTDVIIGMFSINLRLYIVDEPWSRCLRYGERLLFLHGRAHGATAGGRCSTRTCYGSRAHAAAWFINDDHDYHAVNLAADI